MTANRIIDHIFQQPDLPQVDAAALAKLVGDYPYFTAGRLLLAQKDYSINQSMHNPAIKKAMLYSNNPHYVYQFITGELEKAAETNDPNLSDPLSVTTTITEQAPAIAAAEIVVGREEITTTAEEELIVAEAPAMVATEEETATAEEEIIAEVEAPAMVATTEETITEEEETIAEVEAPAKVATEETITEEEEIIAEVEAPAMVATTEETATEEEEITEQAVATEQPEQVATDTNTVPAAAHDHETLKAAYPEDTPDQDEPIKIFPLDIPAEETTLTFQPLYTDDYFAYKRLKEPARADDLNEKGMAEMKSFTDWLRQMKDSFAGKAQKDWYHQHLHHIYEDEEPEVSEAVEQMAMKSITLNDDIVSETLAEIWARQHQYQSAIHIYQKLSLLNPDKSAYFAQKIQELQLAKDKINSNKH